MAEKVVQDKHLNLALACRTFGISQSCCRYERQLSDENAELADWVVSLFVCVAGSPGIGRGDENVFQRRFIGNRPVILPYRAF